jgi:hypothetical protein
MFQDKKDNKSNCQRYQGPECTCDNGNNDRGQPSKADTKQKAIFGYAIYPTADKCEKGCKSESEIIQLRAPNFKQNPYLFKLLNHRTIFFFFDTSHSTCSAIPYHIYPYQTTT